jgi:hypothetical protein
MADLIKMENTLNVLTMLIPGGGFTLSGDSFNDVEWYEATPITQAQFDKGVADYSAWEAEQDAKAITDKETAQAKLAALGLTADDLKALGL